MHPVSKIKIIKRSISSEFKSVSLNIIKHLLYSYSGVGDRWNKAIIPILRHLRCCLYNLVKQIEIKAGFWYTVWYSS